MTDFKNLQQLIEQASLLCKNGKCADYIPLLAKADPCDLGLCLIDGERSYSVGEYGKYFSIQSISKIAGLMCALLDNGIDSVFNHVGYNGSSEPFNTFYKLELSKSNKPQNPMINAGAIVTTSLIKGDKFSKILNLIRLMTGNPNIDMDFEIYKSESSTGFRNIGLAYLLRASNVMVADVDGCLDAYFKQCSILVNCEDLARMASFIGKGCIGLPQDKITNKQMKTLILGIMSAAGMYDYSGEYMVDVGIPSKSGVGGGIMGVGKNGIGIGIYGPSLDSSGNSIAGIELMKLISQEYNMSIFFDY